MKRWIGIVTSVVISLIFCLAFILILKHPPQTAAAPDVVQLALAHLAPFAPDPYTAVTVTVNGIPVLTDVEYGDTTGGYVPLPFGGSYTVRFIPIGSLVPVLTKTLVVTDGHAYTAVGFGGANGQELDVLLIEDDTSPPSSGWAKVRVGHLAPFASTPSEMLVDVCYQDGTIILNDLPYGSIFGYLNLPVGEYDLKVMNADNTATLIDLYPVSLGDGDIVSVFATGDGSNQLLGAFAMYYSPDDGFMPLAAAFQFAHLAPFGSISTTAVTVTLKSAAAMQSRPVLTNVIYGMSSGYLPVVAGEQLEMGIVPVGAVDPILTRTLVLTQGKGFASVLHGGANAWDLGLMLLDDNVHPDLEITQVRIGHLAPFSNTITGTLVDIRTQTGLLIHPALDDVPYGAVTDFIPLPTTTCDLRVTDGDNTMTLMDLFPVTFSAGDILSLFAVGYAIEQPLGVYVLPVGQPGYMLPLAQTIYTPFVVKTLTP